MIYRFIIWLKSLFGLDKTKCQTCGVVTDYGTTSTIKVRYENGAILDLVICKACGDKLEASRKK